MLKLNMTSCLDLKNSATEIMKLNFDLLPGSERVKADWALRRSILGAERGVCPGDGSHGHQQGGAQDLPQRCQLHQGDHGLSLTFNPDRSIGYTFCEHLFIFHLSCFCGTATKLWIFATNTSQNGVWITQTQQMSCCKVKQLSRWVRYNAYFWSSHQKARNELKVVLFHLWRINVKTIGRFINIQFADLSHINLRQSHIILVFTTALW